MADAKALFQRRNHGDDEVYLFRDKEYFFDDNYHGFIITVSLYLLRC